MVAAPHLYISQFILRTDKLLHERAMLMIACAISLVIGLIVGVCYGFLGFRSPAPPIIALIGLLGIVLGEQIPSVARHLMSKGDAIERAEIVNKTIYGGVPKTRSDQSQKSQD